MSCVVLDAEALSSLARGGRHEATVRAALAAAVAERTDVLVPAAVLAECYRGSRHDHAIDACLSRQGGIGVVPTDRPLARRIGHLLASAGRGSEHHVDATVVAVCATTGGGGIALTGDVTDLAALTPPGTGIVVRGWLTADCVGGQAETPQADPARYRGFDLGGRSVPAPLRPRRAASLGGLFAITPGSAPWWRFPTTAGLSVGSFTRSPTAAVPTPDCSEGNDSRGMRAARCA